MENKTKLLGKIADKSAVVGVIGQGYVGLPLSVELAREGFRVVGVDIDPIRVEEINAGRSAIDDVKDDVLSPLVKGGLIQASESYDATSECDVIAITVPTPLSKTKDPDVSYIMHAVNELKTRLKNGALVVLESTTYPGTTDELIQPALEENGRKVGHDFYLAFSAERVDPGNPVFNTKNTPKVVGGITPTCTEVAVAFYEAVLDTVVAVSSTRAAEMVKLLENTYRIVNIGLVNEVALMCRRLGIDVWEIIDAAATKPFGFQKFYPGPGVGGHCIPIDPHYLSWKLKALNYYARFIELAGDINARMPEYVVELVSEALNRRSKAIKGSSVLVLGVAYKKDVSDLRESPALDVIRLLGERGADVSYHDPYVLKIREDGGYAESVELTDEALSGCDCAVIVTDHTSFDAERIVRLAPAVVDTRNLTKDVPNRNEKVVLL
jgi:UDP-N-acetyl-D-glucosamine dehydrogenase